MTLEDTIDAIQQDYPRIWHAAHRRHPPRGLGDDVLSERAQTVLTHLGAGWQTVAALCDHLGIAPSTLSEVLGALEERGLVRRRRATADRRRIEVTVTEAGAQRLRDASPLDAGVLTDAIEKLTDHQRAIVVNGLALLAEALR